jgi:carboxyl-terminal processing protease
MPLQLSDRKKLLDKVASLVEKKHFNPALHGVNWRQLVESRCERILSAETDDAFEKEMDDLVRHLKTSHTGFLHRRSRRVPARNAISATFLKWVVDGSEYWMFQDVHPGGAAFNAGVQPGDVLLTVGDRPVGPPEQPEFGLGESTSMTVRKRDGKTIRIPLQLPRLGSKRVAISTPQPVLFSTLPNDIAYLKVTMFPGAVGIDVAADIDKAINSFKDSSKLIIDLRGNTGGGIGGLRLMGYLTPERREVGYSLTRKRAQNGYKKEDLMRFGKIPKHKRSLIPLVVRYAFAEKSIAVVTEGLGPQPFHGRIVILVNEHTASAGEMVAAFAQENNLATIVGEKTAGRLLSGDRFNLGHGYLLGLPTAQYLTWNGKLIEGAGVAPDLEVGLNPEALQHGRDTQLEKTVEILEQAEPLPLGLSSLENHS